jgi:hypothetical protein
VEAASRDDDLAELPELALHEGSISDRPVAGHDRALDQRQQPLDGCRPLQGIAVAEVRHGVVLQQIAGECHARVRHEDDDVGVGVAPAEVPKLDRPPADRDRRRLGERPVGRLDDEPLEVAGELGHGRCEPGALSLAVLDEARAAAIVAPDDGRPEVVIAEHVVGVPVAVDHQAHGKWRQAGDVGEQLPGVRRGRPGVDDEGLVIAEDDADLLVVEPVAPGEDAVADLEPVACRCHGPMVRASAAAAV